MSKLEETNLMIEAVSELINTADVFSTNSTREAVRTTALLDIAKSLAIIADNTSNRRD